MKTAAFIAAVLLTGLLISIFKFFLNSEPNLKVFSLFQANTKKLNVIKQ